MPKPTPPAENAPPSRQTWPWWVRFPLYGVTTRRTARASFWAAVILAAVCVALGFAFRQRFPSGVKLILLASGLMLVLGAWWYHRVIAWVDRNGSWKQSTASRVA